ncbi:hypothetical protein HC931_27110 [Candidatus Gracilibacteria bacterium]|nr:hypothetical protein [Candidatus Gracilibacteria bacterium]NJM90153.1 hypothetical protein [Hydrococcus sp. RU_2_2]NJP20426.1 hypothetical protein [Hydrococcus sp. CRU_1_1]
MKNSGKFQNTVNNSALSLSSPQKYLNSIDPCDREFNFELWANLVREQMQTVLHRSS